MLTIEPKLHRQSVRGFVECPGDFCGDFGGACLSFTVVSHSLMFASWVAKKDHSKSTKVSVFPGACLFVNLIASSYTSEPGKTILGPTHPQHPSSGGASSLMLVFVYYCQLLVCFRFLYRTDGGSNRPILVPISRQHYLPDPVNQGNHVVYPPLFTIPHSSAGSPIALSGTPSASYRAA